MNNYSVLMSVYIKENPVYLRNAIDSMLSQSLKADEIIVVEDGVLSNELYDVLDSYGELIRRIKLSKNVGLGLALNEGIRNAKNEIIARMDTDDISKRSRCEEQMNCFDSNPDLDIVGAWIDEFDSDVNNIVSTRKVPENLDEIYEYAKRRSAFNHPTVMYKKSSVLKFGGYSNLRRNQDVDLFGRMLFGGAKAYNIQKSLLLFRINTELSKRRKSWSNTKLYIKTIYNFWKIGYSKLSDLIIVAIAQFGLFIMPASVQNLIYKNLLRK